MLRLISPDSPRLLQRYESVRSTTAALASPLSPEDACVQSMPDASPAKWHLAHTTWFFETFVLEPHEQRFEPFDAAFRLLFNSYYNGVGEQFSRPHRGMLTRPSLQRVIDYRKHVDERVFRLLSDRSGDRKIADLVVLGINHEQQHQELLLTDIKHLLSMNPMRPVYRDCPPEERAGGIPLQWIDFAGGTRSIGHTGDGFSFDNEGPRHPVALLPYRLGSRLVTNGEYLMFLEDGGYETPSLWLSEGWKWIKDNGLSHPIYWSKDDSGWREFNLSGSRPLAPDVPITHVSYFEADAYARWADARLPTEAEWECAAESCALAGNFLESGLLGPRSATGRGLQQMFGDAWEWTRSSYAPYPGYRAPPGAIGEYNGKFMVNQYVLRGGSFATPADHIRPTYRNFFPTSARWQFSGIRLANDP